MLECKDVLWTWEGHELEKHSWISYCLILNYDLHRDFYVWHPDKPVRLPKGIPWGADTVMICLGFVHRLSHLLLSFLCSPVGHVSVAWGVAGLLQSSTSFHLVHQQDYKNQLLTPLLWQMIITCKMYRVERSHFYLPVSADGMQDGV